MIVRALQVKGVEGELNTCRSMRKWSIIYIYISKWIEKISHQCVNRKSPFNEHLTNKAVASNWRNCTLKGDVCGEVSCGVAALSQTVKAPVSKRQLVWRDLKGRSATWGRGRRGRNSVREIEFDCCMCLHRVPLLTFAVGGLDYPGAVQVVGVKVRESRWQDGTGATVNVTSTQRCQVRGKHLETKRMREEKNQRTLPQNMVKFVCLFQMQ